MDAPYPNDQKRPFLNRKRLLAYPRLFLIALWSVVMLNFALRDGWDGGIRGIFGYDFLVFYSSGLLYRQDIDQLYDVDTIAALEESLIAPTSLHGGFNVNSYPPYVALLTSGFTWMPFLWAYLVWSGLSLFALFVSSRWLSDRLLPFDLRQAGLTSNHLLVILLSFFPLVLGLQNGQNHAFTLLLITGILIFTIEKKPIRAGLMAGLLIYKPQFVLGYLILWLIKKEYRALLAAGLVAAIWAGAVLVTHGIQPYVAYFNQLQNLFLLPYGVAGYIEATPLALVATLLPLELAPLILRISQVILIGMLIVLAWLAYRLRSAAQQAQFALLILAGLFPFIASPHVLVYDLVVFAPLFALWSCLKPSRGLLYGVIGVYLGSIILPPLSQWLGLALMGVFPLAMLLALPRYYHKQPEVLEPGVIA